MPSTIKCPHCRAALETDLPVGQALRCPACKEGFRIERGMLVRKNDQSPNFKIMVALGYVAFVLLPLVLTVVFLFMFLQPKPAGKQNEEQPVAKADPHAPGSHEPKKTPKRGPPPRPTGEKDEPEPKITTPRTIPEKGEAPDLNPGTSPKAETAPMPRTSSKTDSTTTPVPSPKTPMPGTVETSTARIVPEPREILWKIPLSGYTSEWQKVGDVHVRIGGLAVAKAQFVDSKAQVAESQSSFLVAIVEVRRGDDAKKNRTVLSWTYFNNHYAAIFLNNDKEILPGEVPPGSKLQTKLEKQTLPDDGTPVKDILLFSVPADNAGELNLRLDAERCGEKGDIWFKIPALAWKKK